MKEKEGRGGMGIMPKRAVTLEGRLITILRNYFYLCGLQKSLSSSVHITSTSIRLNKHSKLWSESLIGAFNEFLLRILIFFFVYKSVVTLSWSTSQWILSLLPWCHILRSRTAVPLSVLQCSPNTAGRSCSGGRTCTEWLWRWTQHQQQQGATYTYFHFTFTSKEVI